jgi:hypothetical protein
MGVVGLVVAFFTFGYIVGVSTACLVVRDPQHAYEDGVPTAPSSTRRMVMGEVPRRAEMGS